MAVASTPQSLGDYQFGFHDEDTHVFKSKRGLNTAIVREISAMKSEPQWMTDMRLKSFQIFERKAMPKWGSDLSDIDFDDIFYYVRPMENQGRTWEEVPEQIKNTFDKLGIPEAERKFLAGVGAQYDSEVVYHSLREDLEKQGVIFPRYGRRPPGTRGYCAGVLRNCGAARRQ